MATPTGQPQWLTTLNLLSCLMAGAGLLYFRGPAVNDAQRVYRLAVIGVGVAGIVVCYLIGRRYRRRRGPRG